jgi:hypothetical protein
LFSISGQFRSEWRQEENGGEQHAGRMPNRNNFRQSPKPGPVHANAKKVGCAGRVKSLINRRLALEIRISPGNGSRNASRLLP